MNATHVVPWEGQLGEPYGGTLCLAVSTARAINKRTGGKTNTTGWRVRQHTNEVIPNPASPGLNLSQADMGANAFGVDLDVRIGSRAIAWDDYEARRRAGYPCVLQGDYRVFHGRKIDAGRAFGATPSRSAGHGIFEDNNASYDSLADGRYGTHRFDGTLYDRGMVRAFAEALVTSQTYHPSTGDTTYSHPLSGHVWAAFAPDSVPEFRVTIKPAKGAKSRGYNTYDVTAGVITSFTKRRTAGFTATARIRSIPWPDRKAQRFTLLITSGLHAGEFVALHWGKEIA